MKITTTIPVLLLVCLLASCSSSMEDISRNPNKTTEVHPKTIFTTMCVTTWDIDFYGVEPYRTAWMWDGRFGGNTLNFLRRSWTSEYRRIGFLYSMIAEAERIGDERYVHLAAFFRAHWYFCITRLFGDCPYTEGGQGRENAVFTPVYDLQEDIVYGLLNELADANTALAQYDNTTIDGDVIYGGSVRQWRKLINLYRLKILINCTRHSTIKGQDIAEMFAGIVGNPADNPLMESFVDNALLDESGRTDTYVYYNDNDFVSSRRVTRFVVDHMKERSDMRLPVIAQVMIKFEGQTVDPNDLDNYNGIIPNPSDTDPSYNNEQGAAGGEHSRINPRWYQEQQGPSYMLTGYAEQEFILAEAVLRGWITGSVEDLYNAGIKAAFQFLNVGESYINAYISHPKVILSGTDREKFGMIITQKYFNFFLNGAFEPYFELRRTGYPNFLEYLEVNVDNLYNNGYLPQRYMYPQNELDYNTANVTEAISRLDKGDTSNSTMWLLQGTDPLFNPDPFPFRY